MRLSNHLVPVLVCNKLQKSGLFTLAHHSCRFQLSCLHILEPPINIGSIQMRVYAIVLNQLVIMPTITIVESVILILNSVTHPIGKQ